MARRRGGRPSTVGEVKAIVPAAPRQVVPAGTFKPLPVAAPLNLGKLYQLEHLLSPPLLRHWYAQLGRNGRAHKP